MKLINGDKLERHLDYLIEKEKQFAKECSLSPNNEFERQRRYCFEANALAYGLCKNVMDYYLVKDVQPVSAIKKLQEHIKQRILETAFNNGGIYREVAEDIADRIDMWVDEFGRAENGT